MLLLPSIKKVESEANIYPIMVRGINRQNMFADDEDNERFINSAECRFLTVIIRQALVVADRYRYNTDSIITRPDQLLIRTLEVRGESAEWCDTYSPVIDRSRTYESYSLTDELIVRKILKAAEKTNAIWEADIFSNKTTG